MKTRKKIFKNVFNGIGILLNGFFSFLGLSEFYKVGIKNETEFYPFDGEGPVPYYYKAAELYTSVTLIYGIAFGILFVVGVWNLRNNKIDAKILFGLTCFLILIQIIQGTIR